MLGNDVNNENSFIDSTSNMQLLYCFLTIVIIKIALKGASALQSVSNTYADVTRAQPCANHVQHIEGLPRPTCMPHGTKGQLSY